MMNTLSVAFLRRLPRWGSRALLLLCLAFAACTIETSDNGRLDGYWQLTTLDTLATGGTTDMRPLRQFWAVQVHLLRVSDATGVNPNVLFRFEQTDTTLIISQPIIDHRDVSDIEVKTPDILRPYAINHLEEDFRIVTLNGSTMELRSQDYFLHFRKY